MGTVVYGEKPVSIAAVVNQHIISLTDLMNRMKLAIVSSGAQNTPGIQQELMPQILKVMTEEQLQLQLGEEFNLKIEDGMIEAAMAEIETQNDMPTGELKRLLENNDIPLNVMKTHLKANLIWREYIRERYKDAVQISEAEIERALAQLEADKKTRRYAIGEILISTNKDDKTGNALGIAHKIMRQLDNGAQFTALAAQFSNAPSASHGGDIGWVSNKSLDKELVRALDGLSPGQFSQPIATERGYYILHLKDRLEPGEIGKAETYFTFKQILLPHPRDAFEFELRENLNRAHALARSISSCRVAEKLVKNNDGQIQNANKVPVSRMPQDLRNILMSLSINQASTPVFTEQGAVIFVLCAKETVNPQAPSRNELRDSLLEKKLQMIAEREMRNRRRAAHIDIRLNMKPNDSSH